MNDLITRLEAAPGPDRELDAEILKACGHQATYRGVIGWEYRPDGVGLWRAMPSPTASIDAALTLAPEGWGFKAECGLGHGNEFTVGHVGANKLYDQPEGWGSGTTPAIALCIAALRARAALKSPDHQSNASEN